MGVSLFTSQLFLASVDFVSLRHFAAMQCVLCLNTLTDESEYCLCVVHRQCPNFSQNPRLLSEGTSGTSEAATQTDDADRDPRSAEVATQTGDADYFPKHMLIYTPPSTPRSPVSEAGSTSSNSSASEVLFLPILYSFHRCASASEILRSVYFRATHYSVSNNAM